MNKKLSLGAAIAFMLIVATATFSMTMIYATTTFNEKVVSLKEREVLFEKFSEIDRQVRQRYSDTINETQLMDSVAEGYMKGLGDKYAEYLDARAYERELRERQGEITGIGADMEANVGGDGYLVITRVYADSPARAAQLEVGDLVVRIDDVDITTENSARMLEAIQGETGTEVMLTIRRGAEEIEVPPIARRPIVKSTLYASMIEGTTIAYIGIEEFSDITPDQFNRELKAMIRAGANAFIFDVRDNSSGTLSTSLNAAARVLDYLLPEGVIASYTTRDGEQMVYTSDPNEISLPMVVVVNEKTSSASELFAQALRDYDKVRIVGANTTGRGVVQEELRLSDGSVIRFTIAELMGPAGETFNGTGIRPDYEETIEGQWTQTYTWQADAQLNRALEVIQGNLRQMGETWELPVTQPPVVDLDQMEGQNEDESADEAAGDEDPDDDTDDDTDE